MADKLKKASRAHTRYYLADGTLVPGATTISGLLNKPALVKWANNLGLQGIDSTKYVDKAANVGTLIHALVEGHITGKTVDTSDFTALEIELAQNGFYKYLDWEKQHKVEPIFNEHFLQVSGYANLLKENKYRVDQIMILNIGRNEDEPFQHREIPPTTYKKYFDMFKALVKVYYIKKELEWR